MPSPDSPPKPAPGFAGLARRIRRRTTDLLAIGVVVIAALTIGRQTIVWWKTEPLPSVTAAPSHSTFLQEGTGTPIVLEFGEQPVSLTRQVLQGSRTQALAKLADLCRAACNATTSPPREVAEVEATLLDAVRNRQPFEELTDHWRLYQLDDALPMVAGIRRFTDSREPSSADPPPAEPEGIASSPPVAVPGHWRLVCWGLAMPLSDQTWTLYLHGAAPTSSTAGSPIRTTPPLPPGSQRILSLRQDGGGLMIGFRGAGPLSDWSVFYARWAREHGWRKLSEEPASNHSYAARFQAAEPVGGDTMDLQLISDRTGEVRGLISIWPGPP